MELFLARFTSSEFWFEFIVIALIGGAAAIYLKESIDRLRASVSKSFAAKRKAAEELRIKESQRRISAMVASTERLQETRQDELRMRLSDASTRTMKFGMFLLMIFGANSVITPIEQLNAGKLCFGFLFWGAAWHSISLIKKNDKAILDLNRDIAEAVRQREAKTGTTPDPSR